MLYPKGNVVTCPVSFETGEQMTHKVYFPGAQARVVRVRAQVTKALAGTDAGTVTVKKHDGTTLGTITIPLSTAVGTEFSLTVADYQPAQDEALQLTSAKTTAGGRATCSIEFFDK